jgi:hypothetical protein
MDISMATSICLMALRSRSVVVLVGYGEATKNPGNGLDKGFKGPFYGPANGDVGKWTALFFGFQYPVISSEKAILTDTWLLPFLGRCRDMITTASFFSGIKGRRRQSFYALRLAGGGK